MELNVLSELRELRELKAAAGSGPWLSVSREDRMSLESRLLSESSDDEFIEPSVDMNDKSAAPPPWQLGAP